MTLMVPTRYNRITFYYFIHSTATCQVFIYLKPRLLLWKNRRNNFVSVVVWRVVTWQLKKNGTVAILLYDKTYYKKKQNNIISNNIGKQVEVALLCHSPDHLLNRRTTGDNEQTGI